MMHYDFVFSGFGGQGVLFGSQLLAYAAMEAGLHVTWIPSYGPEMRGGTANCTVVISDQEIGAPVLRRPSAVVAMNYPSVQKYEPLIALGGLLVYNASLVVHPPTRADIRCAPILASEIAAELGNPKLLNVVLLGALLHLTGALPIEIVEHALEAHLPARRREMLDANRRALWKGAEAAQALLAPA
ncbi:MAG: 2-oxoacid:acceptor oxidoreductase family protein [Anaerolineae bacterium]|nr:2-oxoacid:acceptor oxidoreductase family protein [Thermoflexales bacterium]MDW8408853.1 2-oxoacid:acceptor oxidoreductase family protein [Anaerolineae bacterium]